MIAVSKHTYQTQQVEHVDNNKEMHRRVSQYIKYCENKIKRKSQFMYQNAHHENIHLKLDTCQFQTENPTVWFTIFHDYIPHAKLNIEVNGQY